MLCKLTQDQLARTLMPLGKLSKAEVRGIAEKAGLSVAHKQDSQEICFVTVGSYAYYISEPVVQNDAKGVAPFVLCYTEVKRRQAH